VDIDIGYIKAAYARALSMTIWDFQKIVNGKR